MKPLKRALITRTIYLRWFILRHLHCQLRSIATEIKYYTRLPRKFILFRNYIAQLLSITFSKCRFSFLSSIVTKCGTRRMDLLTTSVFLHWHFYHDALQLIIHHRRHCSAVLYNIRPRIHIELTCSQTNPINQLRRVRCSVWLCVCVC